MPAVAASTAAREPVEGDGKSGRAVRRRPRRVKHAHAAATVEQRLDQPIEIGDDRALEAHASAASGAAHRAAPVVDRARPGDP